MKDDIAREGSFSTRDLEDLTLIGDNVLSVAVPFYSPTDLKKYIAAAIKTFRLRNKSIDHVLKKYGELWNFEELTKEQKEQYNALAAVKKDVNLFVNQISKSDVKKDGSDRDRFGQFAAEAAMIRLVTSFRSAILLTRQGYLFESAAICRLIFEQFCWAYSICKLKDDTVFSVNPTKSITKIKALFPDAGRIYGYLSEFTHINPDITREYIDFSSDIPGVRLNLPHYKESMIHTILVLADMYRIVGEYISADYIDSFLALQKSDDANMSSSKIGP